MLALPLWRAAPPPRPMPTFADTMPSTFSRSALALVAWLGLAGPALTQPAPAGAPAATPAAVATPATNPADPPAGIVKRSQGEVSLERAGQRLPVAAGTVLRVSDTLRTGPASSLGLTLRDDTLLTLGPDAELALSSFAFDATSQDGNLLASLWRGSLHLVTGLIAKKTPERVKVQTRTVVLGARGTEFIVETLASGTTP